MRLTNNIYVHYIDPETSIINSDETFSRDAEGKSKAKARVDQLEAEGKEAFYTIGILTKSQRLN